MPGAKILLFLFVTVHALTEISISSQVKRSNVKKFGLNFDGSTDYHTRKNIMRNPGCEGIERGTLVVAGNGSSITSWVHGGGWTGYNYVKQPKDFWLNGTYEVLSGVNKGRNGSISSSYNESNFLQTGSNVTYYVYSLSPSLSAAPQIGDILLIKKYFPSATTVFGTTYSGKSEVCSVGHEETWTVRSDLAYRDTNWQQGKSIVLDGTWQLNLFGNGTADIAFGRENWPGAGGIMENLSVNFTSFNNKSFTFGYGDTDLSVKANYLGVCCVPEEGYDNVSWPCQKYPSCGRPGVQFSIYTRNSNGFQFDNLRLTLTNDTNPTPWTDNFIKRILEYQPGFLRFLTGHGSSSSLASETGTEFARKLTAHRPDKTHDETSDVYDYHAKLIDLLVLCKYVNTTPWYSIPFSWSAEEMLGLVEFLAGPPTSYWGQIRKESASQDAPWTDVFDEIYLEFGYQLYLDPSPPNGATKVGPRLAASFANDRFAIMEQSPYWTPEVAAKIKRIVNAPTNSNNYQSMIEGLGDQPRSFETLSFTASYGTLVHRSSTFDEQFGPLYAHAAAIQARMDEISSVTAGKSQINNVTYAISEIQMHVDPNDVVRRVNETAYNEWLVGLGGGLSLPLMMLTYMDAHGITAIGATKMLGHGRSINEYKCCPMTNMTYVRSPGLLTDLDRMKRKRPAWVVLEMVNAVMEGKTDMLSLSMRGNPTYLQSAFNGIQNETNTSFIHAFAFQGKTSGSLIVFNVNWNKTTGEENINITLPNYTVPSFVNIYRITSQAITDTNEDSVNVEAETISSESFANGFSMTLPAFSVTLFNWSIAPNDSCVADPPPTPGLSLGPCSSNLSRVLTCESGCLPGYRSNLSGTVVTCLNGEWVFNDSQKCEALPSCPELTSGFLNYTSPCTARTYDDPPCNFSCNLGSYFLGSSQTATCSLSGKWVMGGVCEELANCSSLSSIPGGTFINSCTARNANDPPCQFLCNPGYRLNGSEYTISCNESGEWNMSNFCQALPLCPMFTFSAPFNSTCLPRHADDDPCPYSCLPGYRLEDPSAAVITCTESGSWTHPPVGCRALPSCPDMSTLPYNFDSPCLARTADDPPCPFSCPLGMEIVGAAPFIHCMENGTWDLTNTCQDKPRCFQLSTPLLIFSPSPCTTNYVDGAPCGVVCAPGYALNGSRTVNCTASGWNEPTCYGCPANTYASAAGQICVDCSPDATSSPLSSSPLDCVCNSGFEGSGSFCIPKTVLASDTPPSIRITLQIDFIDNQTLGPSFNQLFTQDIATALNISTSQIDQLVVTHDPHDPSLVQVSFTLHPSKNSKDNRTAIDLSNDLQTQVNDKTSRLYEGEVTKNTNPRFFIAELVNSTIRIFSSLATGILIAIIIGILALILLTYLISKKFFPKSKNGRLFAALFTIATFTVNCAFISWVYKLGDYQDVFIIAICALCLPIIFNSIVLANFLWKEVHSNNSFRSWANEHCFALYWICVVACMRLDNALLLKSRMFYLHALSAPLSWKTRNRILYANTASIFLGDIPMLCSQVIVSVSLQSFNNLAIVALCITATRLIWSFFFRIWTYSRRKRHHENETGISLEQLKDRERSKNSQSYMPTSPEPETPKTPKEEGSAHTIRGERNSDDSTQEA